MKKEINFKVHTPYEPAGDQPQAIKELSAYGLLKLFAC
jgi:excinuclease UvrABC helicase subunit UvrB